MTAAVVTLAGNGLAFAADPLPSWRDTPVKDSLINFVSRVIEKGTADFVPPEERIAVFDNDGTLCVEQPMYFQFLFGVDRVKEQAAAHPEWKDQQPFQAALENDMESLGKTEIFGLTAIVAATHAGKRSEELRQSVVDWLAVKKHPTLHRPYTEMVYQPMLELLAYLRESGFKIYIVTGSVADFLRPWAMAVYGVPPEQIIGSSVETTLKTEGETVRVEVTGGVGYVNNKANKVLAIDQTIGRRPILAFGNSDGDLDMLRFTAGNSRLHWCGLLHHTDGEREFAYDRNSHFGRLDAGLSPTNSNVWWIVDMKKDWETIFPSKKL